MNKPHWKATVLDHLGEIVLVVVTLVVAISLNRSFPSHADDLQIAAVVAVAFVVYNSLANLLTGILGPTIDRLRGLDANDQDANEPKADA